MSDERRRTRSMPCYVCVPDRSKQAEVKNWLLSKGFYCYCFTPALSDVYSFISVSEQGDAISQNDKVALKGECCGYDVELFKSICDIRI